MLLCPIKTKAKSLCVHSLSAELTHACALPISVGCILLHPRGTLTQITAKLPHWSDRHSSCAGNSQKRRPPWFAVPNLVGTIKEIIKDISHFSAVSH